MEDLKKRNIILIGFMGTGKTSVGKSLSTVLMREWFDSDKIIVELDGRTIPKIFEESGEAYFRELEREVIKKISVMTNIVISCGGGVVLDKKNLEDLKKNGLIVLLTAKPGEIYQRVHMNKDRPLLGNAIVTESKIIDLLEQRMEKYLKFADRVIDTTGKTIEEITKEILEDFNEILESVD